MTEQQKRENVRFSLSTNGIEAKALAKILQETHISFREIAKASDLPEPELKIFPFNEGSFEYILGIAAIAGTATAIITGFKSIVDYKKSKLDYKKTVLDAQMHKKNSGPEIIHLNPSINIHFDELIKTISNNSGGFSIKEMKEEKTLFKMTSEEITKILEIEREERNNEKPKKRNILKGRQTLHLVKTSDKVYGMWEFIYDENRIMAEFPKNRKTYYQKLTSGSKIIADLKIQQKFNEKAKVWENVGYQIKDIFKIEQ